MIHIDYKRQQFLQYAALGALTTPLPGFVCAEGREMNKTPNCLFKADIEIALTARVADIPILPGGATCPRF